jgi:glycosyltransferase involved in cell wall biosynthesis
MKVMIVLDSLWVGGTERSIAEMLPVLAESGVSPIVVCLRRREEGVQNEVIKKGFKVFFAEGGGFGSVLMLRKMIRQEQPDLIHSSLYKSNLITRFAATGLGVPVLSSIVNTPYEEVRYKDPGINRLRLRISQHMDSLTSRLLTTHFHAVSNTAKASAMRTLGISSDRITVVERGRDVKRMGLPSEARRRLSREQLNIDSEQFVIANVGRHEYQKGQIYLLEAFATLLRKFPFLLLLIAGRTGKFTSSLQTRIKELSLSNSVRILGHCDDIPLIISAADLFVFPSLYEGLPGSVIEAMALGLPIVASDLEAIREVVEPEKNAVLVKPSDSVELAAAMERMILNVEERQAFGTRSREIFLHRFTLDKGFTGMLQLYENISKRRRKGTTP